MSKFENDKNDLGSDMNNTTKCNQDDVDIYGALIILWKNKLTVFLCIFIAVLFGTMLFF